MRRTSWRSGLLLAVTLVAIVALGLWRAEGAAAGTAYDCNGVDVPVAECEALVALYNETDGPNWTRKLGWLESRQLCTWAGVTCTNAGRVFMLDISTNRLQGNIPPALANLSEMAVLILSYNQLTGSIPPELAGLGKLQGLYLHVNQLTGAIPPELGNMPLLSQLYLNGNQLDGSVPATLGNATHLRDLALNNNPLEGPLPINLQHLNQIRLFHYHNTNLCEPTEAGFVAWLNGIEDRMGTGEPCAPVVTQRALFLPLLRKG